MAKIWLLLISGLAIAGCSNRQAVNPSQPVSSEEAATPVTGPFSADELQKFNKLDPVDSHVHIYQTNPEFLALLQRLNLHVLNIVVARLPDPRDLEQERQQSWDFVRASHGQATLCTTFNPFGYRAPGFSHAAISPDRSRFCARSRGRQDLEKYRRAGQRCKG